MAEPVRGLTRELIAMRVAQELGAGDAVNLGIGLPTLVADFVPADRGVSFQAENGILGYGGISDGDFDPDLINASGQPVTLLPGASFFDSATSFAMIRGGHIDVAVLGGLQVSEHGDLANWFVPERGGGSVGGAMDLAVGAKRLIIAMQHTTRDGASRIVRTCGYPLTAPSCVDLIVTNLAVIEVTSDGLLLRELAPGITVDQVRSDTEPDLLVARDVREMSL
ncbi:MAG TPA: 3-oxoacid CoA-transferase subunit B [Dehalococcoidia bacterium]|nr:3-oxoacid CoA-transferase subunit B [Dehalococcoidia bacterium]